MDMSNFIIEEKSTPKKRRVRLGLMFPKSYLQTDNKIVFDCYLKCGYGEMNELETADEIIHQLCEYIKIQANESKT